VTTDENDQVIAVNGMLMITHQKLLRWL